MAATELLPFHFTPRVKTSFGEIQTFFCLCQFFPPGKKKKKSCIFNSTGAAAAATKKKKVIDFSIHCAIKQYTNSEAIDFLT